MKLFPIAAVAWLSAALAVAQSLPKERGTWKIEYRCNDGRGRLTQLTLTRDGTLTSVDRTGGRRAVRTATPQVLDTVGEFLKRATPVAKPAGPGPIHMPSCGGSVRVGDREYAIHTPPEIVTLLRQALEDGLRVATEIPFEPGRRWRVLEGVWQGAQEGLRNAEWESTWVRRGDSRLFDATFRNRRTNETLHDVIELKPAQGRELLLYRQGLKQYYRGSYFAIQPDRVTGRGDWYRPGEIWSVTIEY